MLPEEFYKLTGVNLTGEEYAKVEQVYTSCQMEKAEFCKIWKENHENEGVSKLIGELMNTINKFEEDIRMLKDDNKSLTEEVEGMKAQYSAEMDNEQLMHRNQMEDFANKIIKAGEYDFPEEIYDAIEEEFGIQFIIRSKWEQSIELTDEEIGYMVKHMK